VDITANQGVLWDFELLTCRLIETDYLV